MAKAKSSAYRAGLKVRRKWLGKAYVDKAFRDADDFTIDLQHYVTEHGWGASWARGVLPLKTRSIMNLAMNAGAPAAMDSFRIAKRILAEKH